MQVTEFLDHSGPAAQIKTHSVPVPLYELKDIIGYRRSTKEVEKRGVISGYTISVNEYEYNGETVRDISIDYVLTNAEQVNEEEIIGVWEGVE
jgi:hypothetical protein